MQILNLFDYLDVVPSGATIFQVGSKEIFIELQ